MKKFGFGLMRLPLTNREVQTSIDIAHVTKMADKFLSKGFTYFDTTACYHNGASEAENLVHLGTHLNNSALIFSR